MGVALGFLSRALSCLAGELYGTARGVESRGTRGEGGWSPERGHRDNRVLGIITVVVFSFSWRELEGGLARGRGEKKKNISKTDSRSCVCVYQIEHDRAIRPCYARHSYYLDGLILPTRDHQCCHQNLIRRDNGETVASTCCLYFPSDLCSPLRFFVAVLLGSVGIYNFDTVFSTFSVLVTQPSLVFRLASTIFSRVFARASSPPRSRPWVLTSPQDEMCSLVHEVLKLWLLVSRWQHPLSNVFYCTLFLS